MASAIRRSGAGALVASRTSAKWDDPTLADRPRRGESPSSGRGNVRERTPGLRGRCEARLAQQAVFADQVDRSARWPRTAARNSSRILSNTGVGIGDRALITCRISAVAVCCSSASRVSLKRRAFWIAIAAWSAKVRSRSICRFGVGTWSRATRPRSRRLPFPHAARRADQAPPASRTGGRLIVGRIEECVFRTCTARLSSTRPLIMLGLGGPR